MENLNFNINSDEEGQRIDKYLSIMIEGKSRSFVQGLIDEKKVKANKCKRAILVGHNGHFDLKFINAAVERLAYKRSPFHPFSVLDTASLSLLVFGQSVLIKACIAAKIDFDLENAHGAAYDTQKECELFCKIYNNFTLFAGIPVPVTEEIDYSK